MLLLLEFRSSGPLQSEEGLLPLPTKDATLLFLHSCQASSPSDVARLMESPIGRRVHGLLTARILTWRLVHQCVTAKYPRTTCKNWAHLLVWQLSILIFYFFTIISNRAVRLNFSLTKTMMSFKSHFSEIAACNWRTHPFAFGESRKISLHCLQLLQSCSMSFFFCLLHVCCLFLLEQTQCSIYLV